MPFHLKLFWNPGLVKPTTTPYPTLTNMRGNAFWATDVCYDAIVYYSRIPVRVYYGAVTFRNSLKLLANIFSRNNSINLKTLRTQNSIKPHISSLGTSRIMNIGDIYTLWYNWWFIHGAEITLATENSFVSVATFFMKKHTLSVSTVGRKVQNECKSVSS